MHDLHAVAIVQRLVLMLSARHDLAIQFHGHAPLRETFELQQAGQGGVGRELSQLAIEMNIHAAILPHPPDS